LKVETSVSYIVSSHPMESVTMKLGVQPDNATSRVTPLQCQHYVGSKPTYRGGKGKGYL
jgi:hypothetical protein